MQSTENTHDAIHVLRNLSDSDLRSHERRPFRVSKTPREVLAGPEFHPLAHGHGKGRRGRFVRVVTGSSAGVGCSENRFPGSVGTGTRAAPLCAQSCRRLGRVRWSWKGARSGRLQKGVQRQRDRSRSPTTSMKKFRVWGDAAVSRLSLRLGERERSAGTRSALHPYDAVSERRRGGSASAH